MPLSSTHSRTRPSSSRPVTSTCGATSGLVELDRVADEVLQHRQHRRLVVPDVGQVADLHASRPRGDGDHLPGGRGGVHPTGGGVDEQVAGVLEQVLDQGAHPRGPVDDVGDVAAARARRARRCSASRAAGRSPVMARSGSDRSWEATKANCSRSRLERASARFCLAWVRRSPSSSAVSCTRSVTSCTLVASPATTPSAVAQRRDGQRDRDVLDRRAAGARCRTGRPARRTGRARGPARSSTGGLRPGAGPARTGRSSRCASASVDALGGGVPAGDRRRSGPR